MPAEERPALVSSYFPNAPARQPKEKKEAAPVPGWAPAIRSVAVPGEGGFSAQAVTLRFPAVRSCLWDRTPRGAPETLSAPKVRLALEPHVLNHLSSQARGAAEPRPRG